MIGIGENAAGSPLCKVTFYSKVERGSGNQLAELTLPYDAKSMQTSYANDIEKSQTIGAESGASQYQKSSPSKLSVTFLLDDTIIDLPTELVAKLSGDIETEKNIQTLLKYGTAVQGKTHEPTYVTFQPLNMTLNHGPSGAFNGMLCTTKVETELVDSSGRRLKAKVHCCVVECLSEKEIKLKSGKSSPDLTHVIQHQAGDSVLLRSASIYGNQQFVHQVAKVNRLASIRSAQVGAQILYPPLER
ncbi:CIS tube protein (plasmid) [Pseudoalteromonas sp. T1lg65]|uniref:CIS tube protein n=1 Tax=Pseudoalteromonas sp. T1lg65 TaxID=2077101 RepID=UPI003F7A80A5